MEEIKKSIMSMGNHKASVIDGVTAECVKYLYSDELVAFIVGIANLCLESGSVPEAMKISVITPLHKNGPKHECVNYRTLSMLPIINKIIMKSIMERLSRYFEDNSKELVDNIISSSQLGFRPKKRREGAIFALQQYSMRVLCSNNRATFSFLT